MRFQTTISMLAGCLILGAMACGSADEGPTGPGPYLVSYRLTLDSTLVVDSLQYRNGLREWGPATAPDDGWTVAFSLASGDTLEAIAWLSASGPGEATLETSWTGGSSTKGSSQSVTAAGPGHLVLALPPTRLP